jgi:hypothetical protein
VGEFSGLLLVALWGAVNEAFKPFVLKDVMSCVERGYSSDSSLQASHEIGGTCTVRVALGQHTAHAGNAYR